MGFRLSRLCLAALLLVMSSVLWASGNLVYKWTYYAPAAVLFTPTVGWDGSVYMATDDSLIRAVSPSGETLWAVDAGGRPSAAMALQGDLLYFPTSQGEIAAYGTDGRLAWRTPLHSDLCSTPAVAADGTVYASTVSGRVAALGPHGLVLWSFNTGDPIVTSPVIGHSGWIFVASTHNLYALSPAGIPIAITRLPQMITSPIALDTDDSSYYVDASGAAWSRSPQGGERWSSTGSTTLVTTAASPLVSPNSVVLAASFSTPPAVTYSIAGTIIRTTGEPLSGVSVSTGTVTTTTDTTGKYTLHGLASGTYTVTPTLTGYGFQPSSRSVQVNGADETGQNFTARAGYSISGTVSLGTTGGLEGVTVTESIYGYTTLTDSSGAYTLGGLEPGVYTVTPRLASYTFSPAFLSVTILNSNMGGANFTATLAAATEMMGGSEDATTDTYKIGAYDLFMGDQVWAPLDIGSHYGSALSADGTLFVPSTGDTRVYLLDRDTGGTMGILELNESPGDMVLADTGPGPRLYFVSGTRSLMCYGALAGPDSTASWSQIGAGPRHLYRRDDGPIVALTEPEGGATVAGTVTLAADATDDIAQGLTVRFLVDGLPVGTASEPPYTIGWNTRTYLDGEHTVAAQARDSAGSVSLDQVTVTVANSVEPDTVYADSPPMTFSWSPGDETGFRVEVASDGAFRKVVATSKKTNHPWLSGTTWTPDSGKWAAILGAAKGAGDSSTTMSWRVLGRSSGASLTDSGGVFVIAGATAPDNLTPGYGAQVSPSIPPTLGWSPRHNADFKVQVSDTRDFKVVRLKSGSQKKPWGQDTDWTPDAGAWTKVAVAYPVLYWQVVGRDAIGRKSTSGPNSLTVVQ